MNPVNEMLLVGIDISEDDTPVIVVSKPNGFLIQIINIIIGQNAEDLYQILIGSSHEKHPL